jgi:phosphohistidine phosphatase
MHLLVVRHATAEEHHPDLPDAARALTEDGRRRFAQVVRGLAHLELTLDLLLHSPLLRAVETADLLCRLLSPTGRTAVSAALAAAPGPELLAELSGNHVAVVGHEPWLSELVAMLLVGKPEMAHLFALKRGGVAWLEGGPCPAGMTLRAFLPPPILRSL